MRHTPGPWRIAQDDPYKASESNLYDQKQVTAGEFVITCIPFGRTDELRKEAEANARLIAASPELLEACRFALKYHQHPEEMEDEAQKKTAGNVAMWEVVVEKLRAAIASAEGRE